VIATIPVSEIDGVYGTSPNTFAINSATNTIYITNYTAKTLPDASLLVIDGASNSVKNIPIRGYPYSVAVNPQTNKIYVTDPVTGGIHWISVIDGENNTVNTIPVGNYSHDVIVNSLTNKIYVTNNEDEKNGTVSIINGSNNAVCTIPVQVRPNAIAINNMTNMIYVANRFSNTISAIYDSPTICTTAIPEFPFIGLILFVSITSIIVFYRIKIS
jgi:DNA-binding beta-propeller fold protein YncE